MIGETVQIGDKTYQVITTDEQGRITEDLPEGYYKLVEIETLEEYQLPENEEDRTYFFGIGKTKPAVKEMVELWSQSYEGNGEITYTDSVATDDGGYIKIGYFSKTVTFDAEQTENGEELVLTSEQNTAVPDGVIIKFNSNNKIGWAKIYSGIDTASNYDWLHSITKLKDGSYLISGSENNTGKSNRFHLIYDNSGNLIEKFEQISTRTNDQGERKILQTSDGGFAAIENFNNTVTIPAENTVKNEEIIIETKGSTDGLLIKYNSEHKVEWAKSFGGEKVDSIKDIVTTKDGECIIVGNFLGDTITIPKEETLNNEEIALENAGNYANQFIIKYNSEGKISWAKSFGRQDSDDYFYSISKVADNKYVVLARFSNINGGVIIPQKDISNGSEIVIKNNTALLQFDENGFVNNVEEYPKLNLVAKKIISTKDNGYILAGSINGTQTISEEVTENKEKIILNSNGGYDFAVVKVNSNNKIEWAKTIGSKTQETYDYMKGITEISNNRYLVQVYLSAKTTIEASQTTLGEDFELLGNVTLIYNSNGLVEYASSEVSSSSQYKSVVATSDGGQIAVGQFTGKIHISADQTSTGEDINVLSNGNTDSLITKYNSEGQIDWALNLGGGTGADVLNDVIKKDDTYIAVGYINGTLHIDKKYTANGEDIDITNSGTKGIIIQFTEEGKIVSANMVLANLLGLANAEDGGYIVTGTINSNYTISAEETVDGQQISLLLKGGIDAVILKYNAQNKIEWYSQIGGSSNSQYGGIDYLYKISYANGEYTAVGLVESQFEIPSSATETGEVISINNEIGGLIVIRYNANGKIKWAKELDVQYTSFDLVNRIISTSGIVTTQDGGNIIIGKYFGKTITISAENTVAKQEITMTPTNGVHTGYVIKFDQEGLVEWGKNLGEKHNTWLYDIALTKDGGYSISGYAQGGIKIPETETITGEKIENITAGAFIVKYNKNDKVEYVKMIDENTSVQSIGVTDDNYTIAGYNTTSGVNEAYIMNLEENTISAEIPEQQKIIVENNKKEYKITTEVEGEGGSISGQGSSAENPYEIVKYGEDSTKDIIITPEEGYEILKITVNGEEIKFVPEEDGSVILDKFTNMTSDKHVVVQFSNTVSTVIVHHYKYGTTEPYESLAEDETLVGEIGNHYTTAPKDIEGYEVVMEELPTNASGEFTEDVQEVIYYYKQIPVKFIVHHYLEGTEEIVPGSEDDQINEEREKGTEYTTNALENLDAKYELVAIPGNASGTLTENETVVTYYYRVKDSAGVIVHHVDTDSKEPIASDVVIPAEGTGKYGDSYTTEVSSEIPANYEYVTRTDNWEGTMVDTLTEVTYEYRLVDPSIINQDISKTATASIDNPKAEIEYGITYTTTIQNYIGKAQVTIVDTLPYKIDVAKSSLNGGTYDEESQTITWVELVDGIDTYTNPESGNIEIHKTIKVVYQNMDVSKETIENDVSGKVKLFTPEKTSEEVTDTATTNTEFKMDITVNKVWEDNDTQSNRRPEIITINVIGEDDRVVQSYDLNVKEGETSHTFTDLPKYNREGNEIPYTVEEKEKTLGDLKFYTNKVEGNAEEGYTITNTFTTPDDEISIIVNKIWNDNDIQANRRPESLTLVVKNGNQEVKTVEITKDDVLAGTTNQWTITIDGLQKYDDNGEEIEYSVEEREKTEGDLKFYEAEENPVVVEDNQATIRNTFVKPEDTTSVTVNKVWNDNNNVNGKRPESIKLQVKVGDNVIQEEVVNVDNANNGDINNWTYTFTNLPKYDENGQEIVYTASEEEANQNDLKFYTNDGVTGDMTSGYTITNTFTVPDKRIELTVNKVWEDNSTQAQRRPDTIVIHVKAENADNNNPEEVLYTYELDVATENSHTFVDLPKYNRQGNEIQYTVEEQEKNPGDLHFYTISVGTVENTEIQETYISTQLV